MGLLMTAETTTTITTTTNTCMHYWCYHNIKTCNACTDKETDEAHFGFETIILLNIHGNVSEEVISHPRVNDGNE